MLVRLVYYSENCLGAPGTTLIAGLNDIMEHSIRRNARDGLTGALLFDSIWFAQVLEGEREKVSRTLQRIIGDTRHSDLVVMETCEIEDRLFPKWWMGLGMLRDDHGALYARLGLPPRFDPRGLTGEQIVAIARELGKTGLARQAQSDAAA